MRCICLLLLFLPVLCVAQQHPNDLNLVAGTGIGRQTEIPHYRSYGLMFQRTVAKFDRWLVRVGGINQVDDVTLESTGRPANWPSDSQPKLQFSTSTVSLGGTVGLTRLFGNYSVQASLQPKFIVFDKLGVEGSNASNYGITLRRRVSLESGIGLSRSIGPHWSIGVLGRLPLLAPQVDLLRSEVICPFVAPCVVLEEQRYDTRPLRLATLSVSVGFGF